MSTPLEIKLKNHPFGTCRICGAFRAPTTKSCTQESCKNAVRFRRSENSLLPTPPQKQYICVKSSEYSLLPTVCVRRPRHAAEKCFKERVRSIFRVPTTVASRAAGIPHSHGEATHCQSIDVKPVVLIFAVDTSVHRAYRTISGHIWRRALARQAPDAAYATQFTPQMPVCCIFALTAKCLLCRVRVMHRGRPKPSFWQPVQAAVPRAAAARRCHGSATAAGTHTPLPRRTICHRVRHRRRHAARAMPPPLSQARLRHAAQ